MGKVIQELKNNNDEVIVNGGSKLDHVIMKIKAKERRFTIILACTISFCILIFCYFFFSSIQNMEEFHTIKTHNLEINYNDGTEEFGDMINLYSNDTKSFTDDKVYNINISNIGEDDVYYTISIVDDEEMIKADGCSDNLIDKKFIRYKINNMETIIFGEDEEVIKGVLKKGENITYQLHVWLYSLDKSIDGHYHGRITVKEKKD